ncbi:hypothetical protein SHIRM173S_07064 [Streptomyces hirsutus]
MSPSLKYLIVSSIACEEGFLVTDVVDRNLRGGGERISALLVMWERAPVRTVSRRYCYAGARFALQKPDSLGSAVPDTGVPGGASTTEGTYNRCERSLLRLRCAGSQRNL